MHAACFPPQTQRAQMGGRVWVGWAGGGGASLTRQVSWCGEKEGECQKSSAARIGRLAFNVVIISMMGGGRGKWSTARCAGRRTSTPCARQAGDSTG